MRITFVSPPPNMNGGTKVIAIYARYLQDFGHDVLVVAPPHPARGFLARVLRRLGLPLPPARVQAHSHFEGRGVNMKTLALHRPVRESDCPDADVIIATWWETMEFVASMSPAKGRQFYFVQHHEVFDWLPQERVRATYRTRSKKIAVAQWLVRAIEDDGNREGCTVVPNAVDTTFFRAPPRTRNRRPRIGTLYDPTPFKGFDVTLDVIDKVRAAFPDAEVVAFGHIPPTTYAERMKDWDMIVKPAQERLREVYATCDVWLSCSRAEGFNLMAMEAMACRTPVVSTRTGWPAEAIVAGVNGALADAGDVQGLADGVIGILRASDAEWARLSEGALATVHDSSWERSARLFEAALIGNETLTAA